jgi:hypothetical protein
LACGPRQVARVGEGGRQQPAQNSPRLLPLHPSPLGGRPARFLHEYLAFPHLIAEGVLPAHLEIRWLLHGGDAVSCSLPFCLSACTAAGSLNDGVMHTAARRVTSKTSWQEVLVL